MKKLRNNNGIFYVVISLIAVLALGSIALAFVGNAQRVIENVETYNEAPQQSTQVDEETLRGFPGGDIYQRVNMHSGYQSGGTALATSSTASAFTLTANELGGDISFLNWTPNVNTTLTLPADLSTGFMDIQNIGDSRTYYLRNASSTTGASITLAAGDGVDLQYDEDSADLAIYGLDWGVLTFMRTATNASTTVFFTEFTEAD